jgi:succinate dehydrogenase hydrophobic anchor subunit
MIGRTAPERPQVDGSDTTPRAAEPGWRLARVTALFLAVLLPVHVAVVVVRDDIGRTTFATVSDRLSGPWWPGIEWATLVLALVHGHAVLRARLARSLPAGPRRDAATVATGVAAAVLGLGATWSMLTFS